MGVSLISNLREGHRGLPPLSGAAREPALGSRRNFGPIQTSASIRSRPSFFARYNARSMRSSAAPTVSLAPRMAVTPTLAVTLTIGGKIGLAHMRGQTFGRGNSLIETRLRQHHKEFFAA